MTTTTQPNSKPSQLYKGNKDINSKILKECNKQIHFFIEVVTQAIIKFYRINVNPGELKRDLIVNLATKMVLADEVYFLVFNLLSIHYSLDLHKLTQVMQNKAVLDKQLNLTALKVKEQFQFKHQYREKYEVEYDNDVITNFQDD